MKYELNCWTRLVDSLPQYISPAAEERMTNLCDPLVVFTDISLLMAGAGGREGGQDTAGTSLCEN